MSFDFFGEGINEETGVVFTADQEAFFKNKLGFLDPEGNKKITLSQALSLLRFSGLPPNHIKKIIDNLKLTGKGVLDYTQMKKVLRGVALAQNKVEPSLININANIKTKLPIFHDDDSDEDEQPPRTQHQPQKQMPTQTPTNIPPNKQIPVPKVPPRAPQSSQTKPSSSDQFKKFDEFWSTLSTDNQKISGGEVKKLFGDAHNRSALSKIWKLCNHTYKGYLTKGQLYVFVVLMKNKNDIPPKLTPNMKDIIQKIDGSSHNPRSSQVFDDTTQNLSKSHNFQEEKKTEKTKNRSSSEFDDFANFGAPPKKQLSVEKATPKKILPVQYQNVKSPKSYRTPQIAQPPEVQILNQSVPVQMYNKLLEQVNKIQTTFFPTIEHLSNSNRQSNAILQQTNNLLTSFEQTHNTLSNRLVELKKNQDDLNYRLNQTCIRMRDVIVKQSDFIAELLQCINQEANMDNERVQVLEGYVADVSDQIQSNVNSFHQQQPSQNKNSMPAQNRPIPQEQKNPQYEEQSNQPLQYDESYRKSLQSMKDMAMSMSVSNKRKQKLGSTDESVMIRQMYGAENYRQQLRQKLKQNNQDENEENEYEEPQRNFKKDQYNAQIVEASAPVYRQSEEQLKIKKTKSIQQQEKIQAPIHSHPQNPQSPHPQQEREDPQDEQLKIRKKQIFTIQLINYLAPIKQEQYPIILQRVTGMTENQLDGLYAQLYKKYEDKLQQQRSTQQQPSINPPTKDQFSSNNFKNYDVQQAQVNQQKSNQVDFFAQ